MEFYLIRIYFAGGQETLQQHPFLFSHSQKSQIVYEQLHIGRKQPSMMELDAHCKQTEEPGCTCSSQVRDLCLYNRSFMVIVHSKSSDFINSFCWTSDSGCTPVFSPVFHGQSKRTSSLSPILAVFLLKVLDSVSVIRCVYRCVALCVYIMKQVHYFSCYLALYRFVLG